MIRDRERVQRRVGRTRRCSPPGANTPHLISSVSRSRQTRDPMAAAPAPQPAVFGSPALDQAVAGVTAGIVSTFALQPLDLLKVQLQVSTAPKTRGTLGNISWGLREIVRTGGARALYRGLTPNLVGNASSWGSYFLWSVHLSPCIARADLTLFVPPASPRYTMLKARMDGGKDHKLSAGQHLLASATSGASCRASPASSVVTDSTVSCRCHHGRPDQPYMGRQDAHVHDAGRAGQGVPRSHPSVPFSDQRSLVRTLADDNVRPQTVSRPSRGKKACEGWPRA